MIPDFPRIYKSVEFTIEYLKTGRIKEHFYKYAGGGNSNYLDSWISITKNWHQYMKDEINQNVLGSKPFVIHEMFAYLQNVLSNWRFQDEMDKFIEVTIEEENEKIIIEYEKQIAIDEDKFKSTVDFSKAHEKPTTELTYTTQWLDGKPLLNFKHPNCWFYENKRKIPLLEIEYLPKYLNLLNEIFTSFKDVVVPYVDRYKDGRLEGLVPELNKQNHVRELPPIPAVGLPVSGKLKFNLSVDQLAYLFRLLYDHGLIETPSKAELKRFIIANMSTKGSENISDKSIGNKLSTTEKAEADFLADKLMDMYKAAKKV